jgi:thiamine phosphate synthase YjbQ (UPF0047 family)
VQHNSIEELTAARLSGVIKRLTDQVRKAAPTSQYRHNRTGEDNADAYLETPDHGARGGGGHHQRQTRPRPMGTGFYGEFDGRRRKRVLVKIIGE